MIFLSLYKSLKYYSYILVAFGKISNLYCNFRFTNLIDRIGLDSFVVRALTERAALGIRERALAAIAIAIAKRTTSWEICDIFQRFGEFL